jgi:hypothetical protein
LDENIKAELEKGIRSIKKPTGYFRGWSVVGIYRNRT